MFSPAKSASTFRHYFALDWTGAERPVRTPAIAVAQASGEGEGVELVSPPGPGSYWSRAEVGLWLRDLIANSSGDRHLVGIDCNLSLAKQTIENLCGSSAGAFDLWEAVEELNREHSNYFAGECWRRAPFREVFWCQGKKPPELAMPLRLTDSACGISHNPLKLVGVGQVGKAGLAGMRLARDLRACGAAIWPFDGARECIKAPMVLVEIYPRLFAGQRRKLDDLRHLQAALRSQASVLSARAASPELDEHSCDALVGAAGMRQVAESSGLPEPRQLPERARIEGWIYGVAG